MMLGFWQKTSAHGRKKLAASSKLNSPCPGYFMRSFFIKWHDLDLLSLLAEDLRHGFQMWFVRVLGNVLRRNIVFEGITFVISVWIVGVQSGVLLWVFLSLRVNEPKTYGFSAKRFRQLHQNCILRLAVKKNCFFFRKNTMLYFVSDFRPENFWLWMKSLW